ncbi:DUF3224 domain-containing protein [Saccharopolyspora oryzae]|uniref:DUF3224 domain-containing protein n=1 Tax=Saccharopolyspora oryzae TaxID=2997343 RepID=A0ABT4V8R7_9PSEU|nr:DUF3224 domain-containing protein [Saccharopolyspora oryzae]MDA3630340.1 DUF3224 domain-containing protein [Saccharopolyspora oryzae]
MLVAALIERISMQTTGSFTVTSWDEDVVGDEHPKLARASVAYAFSGGISGETTCAYALVYNADQTGAFNGMQLVRGTVDGREGAFAVREQGHFGTDGKIHSTFEVVPGSGTGDLAGLRGTGTYTAVHGEPAVPYAFDYELA